MIWAPTVMTGLSAVMGSWKITAISLPRRAWSSAGPMASTSRPWNRMLPCSRAASMQAEGGQGGDGLAGAGLAHQGELLARGQVEGDPVHHLPGAEADAQVLDLEQAHGASSAISLRGSSASRRASPTRISSTRVTTSTAKVAREIHQASRLFLPWASSSPRLGVPSGHPQAQEVQAGERADGPGHLERDQGDHRGEAVGQDVPEDDHPVPLAQRLGGADVVQGAVLEELGAHVGGDPQPAEDGDQRHQQPRRWARRTPRR